MGIATTTMASRSRPEPMTSPGAVDVRPSPARWGRRTAARVTWALVILGLGWRTLRYELAFPMWGDEAFVAVTLQERDLADLSRPPEFYQIVPPGFLYAEWLVAQVAGAGEYALRLIPFLAGIATLFLFWRFARGVTTVRTTLVAVAILAASAYPVRHAAEVKPYATDLLISLILTMLGWRVLGRIRSVGGWVALTAAAVVGVWWSYPSVFVAGGIAIIAGARAIRERLRRALALWAVYGLTLVVCWGVMYVQFAGPQARAATFLTELKTWRDAFPPLAQPWWLPWWLLQVHTGMMLAYPQGGHNFGSTATALLVVVGAIAMGRRRARRPLLAMLLMPLALAMVAAALRKYPYGTSTRIMLYMAPAFCLLAAEGMMAVLKRLRRPRRGSVVVAGLLTLIPLGGMVRDVIRPYVGYDNVLQRREARELASHAAPGDRFVVFNGVTPPPEIPDLMITRWLQRVAVMRHYLRRFVPVPIAWHPDPLAEADALPPGGRLWLVVQRHGDERFFSESALAAYRRALELRLGPPERFGRVDLPNDETWTIWVYSSRGDGRPGSPAGPPTAGRVQKGQVRASEGLRSPFRQIFSGSWAVAAIWPDGPRT